MSSDAEDKRSEEEALASFMEYSHMVRYAEAMTKVVLPTFETDKGFFAEKYRNLRRRCLVLHCLRAEITNECAAITSEYVRPHVYSLFLALSNDMLTPVSILSDNYTPSGMTAFLNAADIDIFSDGSGLSGSRLSEIRDGATATESELLAISAEMNKTLGAFDYLTMHKAMAYNAFNNMPSPKYAKQADADISVDDVGG
jgi:hypothetical protein